MLRMKTGPERNDFLAAGELAYLRLLHLADSALPIGALAHSFGLESLVAGEMLRASDLPGFLQGYLREAGLLEAVACREASRLARMEPQEFSAARWIDINDYLSALKPARESRGASAALGRNFLEAVLVLGEFPLVLEAWEVSLRSQSLIHHSAAFGLVSATFAFDESRAVLAYLHQMIASLVSASQRLLPMGQKEATRILWDLKPAIAEASDHSRSCTLETVSCFMPLLDWGAMEHPALPTRLFIS
jgi:urease accessory protein